MVNWKFKHDIGDMEKLVKYIGKRGRGGVYELFGTEELSKDEAFIFLELEREWLILVSSET